MNATIILHPSVIGRPVVACDWVLDMIGQGYDVLPMKLAGGELTVEARPQETAHTNANVAKMPRHHRQYGHSALPADPDDFPPSAA